MAERVPSLDGLRAYSVALVVLGHMAVIGDAPAIFYNYANFGVEVFFVISGFIITRLLLNEKEGTGSISLPAFYKRRFFRIVPAAYLFIAAAVAIYTSQFRGIDVISALTFSANYDWNRPPVIFHLWSLGVEEQFYVLWPLVLVLFFRQRVRLLTIALCAAPFVTLAFRRLHWEAVVGSAFPTSYDSLAVGCLGAILQDRLVWLRSRWMLLFGAVALVLQSARWSVPGLAPGHTLWPLTHLCIGIFVIHSTQRRYFLLNVAPIVWLGTISYGLYLWHVIFLLSNYRRLTPLLTVIAACLSYYLMERPILRWRRRLAGSRMAVAAG